MRIGVSCFALLVACSSQSAGPSADAGTSDASDAAADGAAMLDASATCSVVAQDCGAAKKCTLAGASDAHLAPACKPAGVRAVGEACMRTGDFGDDDCAAGGFCTFAGVLPPDHGGTRYCRALCDADAKCKTGERCAKVAENDPLGFCVPTCAPFSACPSQMTCAEARSDVAGALDLMLDCRVPGASPVGGGCMTHFDCVADAICNTDTCAALCDGAHPCTSGTCKTFGAAGICSP